MSKPMWEMIVPVISTAHVPNKYFFGELVDALRDSDYHPREILLSTNGGCIVYMSLERVVRLKWFQEIMSWFEAEYPGEFWLRIDQDGDIIEELPKYDW